MKKESLEAFRSFIICNADKVNIDSVDKVELLLNINKLLDPEYYKENIDILSRENQKRKVLSYGKEHK